MMGELQPSHSLGPPAYAPPPTDSDISLDEPVRQTILRDLRKVAKKMLYVLKPRSAQEGGAALRDWDLWGPLFLCIALSIILYFSANGGISSDSLEVYGQRRFAFALVYLLVMGGASVVTLNAQLLGSRLSFFQSVCVLGYCLFPLTVAAAFNLFFLKSPRGFRLFTILPALFWTGLGFEVSGIVFSRVAAEYPVHVDHSYNRSGKSISRHQHIVAIISSSSSSSNGNTRRSNNSSSSSSNSNTRRSKTIAVVAAATATLGEATIAAAAEKQNNSSSSSSDGNTRRSNNSSSSSSNSNTRRSKTIAAVAAATTKLGEATIAAVAAATATLGAAAIATLDDATATHSAATIKAAAAAAGAAGEATHGSSTAAAASGQTLLKTFSMGTSNCLQKATVIRGSM
ncbi:hypothetical protein ACSSS7_005907 [Eimeria intestinalis]